MSFYPLKECLYLLNEFLSSEGVSLGSKLNPSAQNLNTLPLVESNVIVDCRLLVALVCVVDPDAVAERIAKSGMR